MNEASKNTLNESLGILESSSGADYDDFAIDSDDDDINDIDAINNVDDDDDDDTFLEEMGKVLPSKTSTIIESTEQNVMSPIPGKADTATATTAAGTTSTADASASASAPNSTLNSSTTPIKQLKKQTITTVHDDPLSAFLHEEPSNETSNMSSQSQYRNKTAGNTSASTASNPATTIPQTTATTSNSVTQSLSSTFSSFALKIQDAVNTATTGATAVARSSPPTYSNGSQTMMNGQAITASSSSYLERSALASASNSTSSLYAVPSNNNTTATTTTTTTATTTTTTRPTPTIYNTGLNKMDITPNANNLKPLYKPHDLDNVMKSALITSAIGSLLPGERVTIFLSHLPHVKDSTTPHTGIGSSSSMFYNSQYHQQHLQEPNNNNEIWCCVVTFYRLILFSFKESEWVVQQQSQQQQQHQTLQNPNNDVLKETTLKNWVQSASVSKQYQSTHSSNYIRRGTDNKTHYLIQMPLACIDRIEKSTEFVGLKNTTSLNTTLSTPMMGGFSSAAVSLIGSVGVNTGSSSSSSLMGNNGSTITGAGVVGNSGADTIKGSVASGTLTIYGKDNGRWVQFSAPSYADCMRAHESLNMYAFPGRRNLGYLFAFESRRTEVMKSQATAAANPGIERDDNIENIHGPIVGTSRVGARVTPRRYDALAEFHRMVSPTHHNGSGIGAGVGVGGGEIHGRIQCPWTPITRANATYNLCSSYPSIMFAPMSVNDQTPEGVRLLRDTATFRSGGRMQTLSWASKYDGASLWRSAQPKVGLQGNRSAADELFMKKIAESAALANSQAFNNGNMPKRPSVAFLKMLTGSINESDLMLDNFRNRDAKAFYEDCMLKIFDLRPKSSAMANRTAGYGYENTHHYKNTTLSFFGIGNIHAVRDSYQKISALCANPGANDVQWMQLVEETKWLSHIRLILSSSWQAAFHIRYNRLPVLVHCSHGWDRTSQVCSLTQIFLDPYFRTRAGFSCLVEKDFLALGHPFHTRCGHGEGRGGDGSSSQSDGDFSPIFIQFLDCVFQILNQYPDYFEFNAKYLLLLSEHVYSCRFGTLLCDTEREREVVASIRQRTYCLWEYLDSCPELVNKNFSHKSLSAEDELEGNGCLLMPLPTLLRNVTLWVDRHSMYGAKPTLRSVSTADFSDRNEKLKFEHPLHGLNDFNENSLREAFNEASRWKELAKTREEEICNLKKRLKEMEELNMQNI